LVKEDGTAGLQIIEFKGYVLQGVFAGEDLHGVLKLIVVRNHFAFLLAKLCCQIDFQAADFLLGHPLENLSGDKLRRYVSCRYIQRTTDMPKPMSPPRIQRCSADSDF
jgi:hypothetical protein